ncbi:probable glutamate receptor [Penaeus vannamei]|uniref:probable glutamate receptor n=1 Tax=Penaeus vannamei TaxID=6689 RepID=UPI00387F937C
MAVLAAFDYTAIADRPGNQLISSSNNVSAERTGINTLLERMQLQSGGRGRELYLPDLVEFLVTSSGHGQVYILYDSLFESLTTTVKRVSEMSYFSIYKYNGSLLPLKSDLWSFKHREYLRIVIVICQSARTLNIFKQVTALKMETPSIFWIVVLDHDVTQELLEIIREGVQIAVALKTSDVKYRLMTSYINREDNTALRQAGSWWWTPLQGPRHFLKAPLYLSPKDAYRDFGGRKLRSSVVNNWPFFEVTKDEVSGAVRPRSGIDFHVLGTMAEKLNFTYELLLAEDGQWGGVLPNGTVTGMVGMVARREVHFAINEITITGPREVVVDFTQPYFLEASTLISPAPAEKNRAFAVFSPFTAEVWFVISAATLAVGPVLWMVSQMHNKFTGFSVRYSQSLSTCAFNMFRSLVVQGNRIEHRQWSLRFILFAWFFFCYVVYALYAGTLTAMLASPSYEKPIDSLWDLLEAIKHEGYMLNVVFQSANEFVFKEATQGIYKELWDVFDPSVGYVHSWTEGVEKVLTGKFSYMNAQLGAEIRALRLGRHRFHFARNSFYPQRYGMALTSGAPFKEEFDRVLLQLTAAGLVDKWTRDELASVRRDGRATEGPAGDEGPGAITLVHLQAAFFLLVLGCAVSAIVLVGERLAAAMLPRQRGKGCGGVGSDGENNAYVGEKKNE